MHGPLMRDHRVPFQLAFRLWEEQPKNGPPCVHAQWLGMLNNSLHLLDGLFFSHYS